MLPDDELLRRYASDRDERAFAALVERYVGLVYTAALRRSGGRTETAEEISQSVFAALARKAGAMVRHPSLAGWLYRTTRYVAIDAARTERRRRELIQQMANLPKHPGESPADWERLRPVIDQAMDRLGERDRQILLMRFFEGLSFGAIAERTGLKENAARMRSERALDRLRRQLARFGITSTGAALSVALADPAFASAPAGIAASLSAGALAAGSAAPVGAAAFLLMNKITLPVVSALLASGLTALLWTSNVHGITDSELAALRRQNATLRQATQGRSGAAELASAADAFSRRTAAVVDILRSRHLRSAIAGSEAGPLGTAARRSASVVSKSGYSNHSQSTPRDAGLTFAWAADSANIDVLSKLIAFDGEKARTELAGLLATLPPWFQAQYPTPESFLAFLCAADALLAPPPGEDVLEQITGVPIGPGLVRMVPGGQVFQETPDGWKMLFPEQTVLPFARAVLANSTLANLGGK